MANVKQVKIKGTLPFNCTENDDMCKLLGQLSAPALGISLEWIDPVGMIPNEYGGTTMMYSFEIKGEEAVSFTYLDNLTDTVIKAGGTITLAEAKDIEDFGAYWCNLKHQPKE